MEEEIYLLLNYIVEKFVYILYSAYYLRQSKFFLTKWYIHIKNSCTSGS